MSLKNLYQNRPGCNPGKVPLDLSSDEVISLIEDILDKGLSLRTRVTGMSMAPFLKGGEILTITKVVRFSSLRIGDLIFFRDSRGFPVVHRIVRREHKKNILVFQTKGDSLLSMDDPVSANDVLGKVTGIEKIFPGGKARHIDMESLLQRSINHFLAVTGFYRSRGYFALQKSGIYLSLRSLVKKTLV